MRREPTMWRTDTPWFMVALIMTIFAVGGVVFGRFEQHKPRSRRVLKQVLVLAVFMLLDTFAGRAWAYGLLALAGAGVLSVHGWWLPKHGINGWTAEPYEEYLALITRTPRRESRSSPS
jgi:O-antigen/teichoic acid export membrane protein